MKRGQKIKQRFSTNEYDLPALTRGNIRFEWVNLDEGNNGDYDPDDPEDVNLLRFDGYRKFGKDWEEIGDSSYCTQMPASTPLPILRSALEHIMESAADHILSDGRAKRIMEELSWISPKMFKT